ncbi:MAG: tRNA lysidine(34) synthetase TilS [Pseudomarimonas sp.]
MSAQIRDFLTDELNEASPNALAVAFSGGMDSTVLLHALASLPAARSLGLRALHVDHGLHTESPIWAAQCVAVCAELSVPIHVLRCHVDVDSGLGVEGAAREARYAALRDALAVGEWLATAQHQDDQAETLLLRLLRGSGTAALGGMRATRALGHATLWRPLLACPQQALRAYAVEHALTWIEDPANADPRHQRSWLRNQVIPLLRTRWPQASAALAASAGLLAADADLLEKQIGSGLGDCIGADSHTLVIAKLLQLSPTLRSHVLRLWLQRAGADPLPQRLHARIGTELIDASNDGQPLIRYRQTRIRRYRGWLHVSVGEPAVIPTQLLAWDGRSPLRLDDGSVLQFSSPWSGGALSVGYRQGGERIRLPGRKRSHSLKHVLQDSGIAPWLRPHLPLLWAADGELLAAGEQVISATLAAALQVQNNHLHWQRTQAPGDCALRLPV